MTILNREQKYHVNDYELLELIESDDQEFDLAYEAKRMEEDF
jgi:hypothetical protein